VERTADEFSVLLAKGNFKLAKIHPTTTHQSIVEAIPV